MEERETSKDEGRVHGVRDRKQAGTEGEQMHREMRGDATREQEDG